MSATTDLPPQLGDIPHTSALHVPTLSSTLDQTSPITTTTNSASPLASSTTATGAPGATAGFESGIPSANTTETSKVNGSAINTENAKTTLVNAKDTVVSSAQQAMDTISNHPVTQNVKEQINNAPITQVAKDQTAKTSAEFDNLKAARRTPETTLSNDQPLTHYHSFFYTLLSWENPRATGIAFAISVIAIFAFRYLPALRWLFKSLYVVFGAVAGIEIISKLALGTGVAQSMRPRRYITIPRETLEASLEDVEQLINFFVIEFQRILFAENIRHTVLAFAISLISYFLIKFVPTWGLLLIGDVLTFSVPLIYTTNKEVIDHYLNSASQVASAQAEQVRQLASESASQATTTLKAYAGDATAKVQDLTGAAKVKASEATAKAQDLAGSAKARTTSGTAPTSAVRSEDFPRAPKQDPLVGEVAAAKPIATPAY